MESNQTLGENVKKASKRVMIIGALIALLGILAIVYPEGFGKVSVSVIGVFFVVGGLLRLFFAAFSYSWGNLFMRYLYGIILVVAGVWVLSNPDMGLEALTLIIAIFFLIDGFTELFYSFSLMPIGGGFYLLISGLISIALSVLIFIEFPESSNYFLGIYLGVKFLMDGLSLTLTGRAFYKNSKSLEEQE